MQVGGNGGGWYSKVDMSPTCDPKHKAKSSRHGSRISEKRGDSNWGCVGAASSHWFPSSGLQHERKEEEVDALMSCK